MIEKVSSRQINAEKTNNEKTLYWKFNQSACEKDEKINSDEWWFETIVYIFKKFFFSTFMFSNHITAIRINWRWSNFAFLFKRR